MFSATSGTIFNNSKMQPRDILSAAFIFISSAHGTSSCQTSRLLGQQQKSSYMMAMKFRRVLLDESRGIRLNGVVEIDGGIFGGHFKFESSVRPLFNKRFRQKNTKQRRCLVVAKQRLGRTVVFVGKKESDAVSFLRGVIEPGSVIQIDGSRAWHGLEEVGELLRTEHLYTFGTNTQHTNNAESFFSGFRRVHRGVHGRINGDNMLLYASELAWKRDHKELPASDRFIAFMRLCLAYAKPVKWDDIRTGAFEASNMLRAA